MDHFFRYFIQDIGRIFYAFLDIFSAVFTFLNRLLNFPERMALIKGAGTNFTSLDWVLFWIANLALVALIVLMIFFLIKGCRRIFRFRVPVKKYEEMERQVKSLRQDLIRTTREKDRLLAMRAGDAGQGMSESPSADTKHEASVETSSASIESEMGERNTVDSPCVSPADSRFYRLTTVDNHYKTEYVAPEYEEQFTLSDFCDRFRAFAASRLHLYYETDMIRYFVASLGTARIIILQGISGTGKTSLPYAFGKFVQKDSTVVSVQPSWRERTELYGYYNEFTRKYTETDFLRAVYESNYYRDPSLVILDEMNIARVEYYFAEMLSVLELPLEREQKIEVTTATWDNDPCLIMDGKVQIPNNVWFVGTINNDDSTFAVADKVYDRAIPIDLDARAAAFEVEDTAPIRVSTDRLHVLFDEAKKDYPISTEMMEKLENLNAYLIRNFRLAFGNRVMKQLLDFVPCFIACGGSEIGAVDFMVAKKVLRKFESLSLGFMKDELAKFSTYLDKTFGKDAMKHCKTYVEYLKKTN